MSETFKKLAKLDVSEHVEKKGRFSYLSWPWAVKTLREAAPDATWEVIKYDGKPYCATETGYFVEVAVTVDGITLSQIHPVLDNNNRTIVVPNAFQINTSIQRCLVKAIALHGLGLYIYAGEDLPEDASKTDVDPPRTVQKPSQAITPIAGAFEALDADEQQFLREQSGEVIAYVADGNFDKAQEITDSLDNEEKLALWSLLDSKTRSALKKHKEAMKAAA
jgi:hypothetical protein